MKRNLDGVYFRVQQEDGSWDNVCFTDLTENQRSDVMEDRDRQWLKMMCHILAMKLREIGDTFDIVCE